MGRNYWPFLAALFVASPSCGDGESSSDPSTRDKPGGKGAAIGSMGGAAGSTGGTVTGSTDAGGGAGVGGSAGFASGGVSSGGLAGGGAVGGSPATGGASSGTVVLGSGCSVDEDCGAGLFCVGRDSDLFFGGGPQGGLCAADCSENGQLDCSAIDPASVCVAVDDAGTPMTADDDVLMCFPECTPGTVFGEKCLNRPDLACFASPTSPMVGVCQPTCGSDFECGPDRVCDLSLGVCVDPEDRSGTLPIGAECNPGDDQCEGFCAAFADGINLCSGLCNLSAVGCGVDPTSTNVSALCLFVASSPSGLSDLGLCGQLCDVDEDCLHPELVCDPFPAGTGLDALTGRAGFCSTPEPMTP